jgi:hypothetical protein
MREGEDGSESSRHEQRRAAAARLFYEGEAHVCLMSKGAAAADTSRQICGCKARLLRCCVRPGCVMWLRCFAWGVETLQLVTVTTVDTAQCVSNVSDVDSTRPVASGQAAW